MRAARARKSLTPPPSLSRSLKRRQTWAPAFWDVGGASTSQACTAARQGEATQGPPGGRRLVSSSVYLGFPVSPSGQRPRGQGLVLSWRVPLLCPHPPPAHYRVSSRVSALHDAAAVYQSARLMWREQTAPPSPPQKENLGGLHTTTKANFLLTITCLSSCKEGHLRSPPLHSRAKVQPLCRAEHLVTEGKADRDTPYDIP